MNFDPALVWFLVGLGFVMSEFLLPGVILVFFGLGAWVTALAAYLGLADDATAQLLWFGASSIVLLVLLRRWFRARLQGYVGDDHDPSANIDDDLLGVVVTVTAPVGPDHDDGRVEYKGSNWRARSEESIPPGSRAVVVRADGVTLHVRPQ